MAVDVIDGRMEGDRMEPSQTALHVDSAPARLAQRRHPRKINCSNSLAILNGKLYDKLLHIDRDWKRCSNGERWDARRRCVGGRGW